MQPGVPVAEKQPFLRQGSVEALGAALVASPAQTPRWVPGSGGWVAGCARGASGGPDKGSSGGHLLHMFYLFLVWNSYVSGAVNLTRFLNL